MFLSRLCKKYFLFFKTKALSFFHLFIARDKVGHNAWDNSCDKSAEKDGRRIRVDALCAGCCRIVSGKSRHFPTVFPAEDMQSEQDRRALTRQPSCTGEQTAGKVNKIFVRRSTKFNGAGACPKSVDREAATGPGLSPMATIRFNFWVARK